MTNAARAGLTGLFDRPYPVLILTTLFWGGNVVAGKLAVGEIDAHALMVLRWTGALLCVLPFAIRPLRQDWPLLRGRWWLYLFFGVVGYATFNVFVYVAAYFTSGVNIALEQVTINIFVLLINFALFRTRVRALQMLGVLVTVLGVATIAGQGDIGRLLRLDLNTGDALVLFACLAYAIYSVALRWRPQTSWLSFLVATFIGAIIGSIAYAETLGPGLAALAAAVPGYSATAWLIVLYTAIFPSVLSQMLYVRGVELIGANRASLFINLVPFFGTLGSIIVLGERLAGYHLVAGALLVIGIVLAEWSARRA